MIVSVPASNDQVEGVLLFGGSFDPPHLAHAELPVLVAEQRQCQRIVYIPANLNPLKSDDPPTPAEHRLAMLEMTVGNIPHACISSVEVDRPGPSYFVDTVAHYRQQLGVEVELHFLIGADQAVEFTRWKNWQTILEQARPAVMLRPPWSRDDYVQQLRERYSVPEQAEWWIQQLVDTPMLDLDSTTIRQRIRDGRSVAGMVPAAVAAYIREHQLYRD